MGRTSQGWEKMNQVFPTTYALTCSKELRVLGNFLWQGFLKAWALKPLNKNIPMTRVQETHVTWKYSIQWVMVSDNNIFAIHVCMSSRWSFSKSFQNALSN
jgi:hypothetical protein